MKNSLSGRTGGSVVGGQGRREDVRDVHLARGVRDRQRDADAVTDAEPVALRTAALMPTMWPSWIERAAAGR